MKRTILFTLLSIPLAFALACGGATDDGGGSGRSDPATTRGEAQVTRASGVVEGAGLEAESEPVSEAVPESRPESGPVSKPQNGTVLVVLEDVPAVAAGSALLAGDGNADGCITGADYTIWADNYGTPAPAGPGDGDYNGDGAVTGADYTVWADNYGDCAVAATIEEIQVTPSTGMLTQIGETMVLSAQGFNAGGQALAANFTWQSSHPDQLDVDQTGRVTAMGMGSAEIRAEAGGVASSPAMLEMMLVDPNAYVANTAADAVTVIDTLTNAVLSTIPVGASPTRVAVTQDGARVYVANTGGSSVSVIDTSTNAVVATVPVTNAPSALAVTPDGAHVYLLGSGGLLQVIDTALIGTASDPVTATISFGAPGFNQYGTSVAILPDGTRAYAVVSGSLRVIDTATLDVLLSIDVGSTPSQLVISPDGTRIYVTSALGNVQFGLTGQPTGFNPHLVVLDTATHLVMNRISLGNLPDSIALTPDGSRAYVAMVSRFLNSGYGMGFAPDNQVAVVDLLTQAVTRWITVPSTPAGVAITPDGLHVLVAIPGANSISVIDTETDTLVTAIDVDPVPTGLAIASAQALGE